MLHLRIICPCDRSAEVTGMLESATGVTNVVVLPGAGRRPEGDVILFDVAREAANEVLARLKELGVAEEGSIAVERVDLSLSRVAEEAEAEAPGAPEDAVVWDELARQVSADARITWAYLAFLVIATQIAAIGVLLPSLILIVGAMVLGPEFGAVAAISFGLLRREPRLMVAAARTLVIGFAVAIAVTCACALAVRGLGWIGPGSLNGHDEVTFIVKPDKWAFIVALLAGAAGVLSVTAGKSSALVGVFISVTTVPAAGYAAVAVALGRWQEVAGSATQLLVNIAGMATAGTITLLAQRFFWARYGLRIAPPARRMRRNSSV
ncbi:hypothetical protein Ssi03_73760 [Sphaerisporangium siamense]|uniref:Putative hydrophobic protein (TIGR00271 family) n=1 Tax=Sphaerisporangium siamense TaxID=795645 RepID=A0A7W7GGH8_9ACTN|nr:DUF389 domain-containing protein [Sphaerisporangium siamense]MBB4706091.1 putative hydrophobic protein (TIGR00271 family) [Sphaerisporangium siamense]GII89386.1 hypothetical protein Ssi03_73760 [Sphaerisporangium siamense]